MGFKFNIFKFVITNKMSFKITIISLNFYILNFILKSELQKFLYFKN